MTRDDDERMQDTPAPDDAGSADATAPNDPLRDAAASLLAALDPQDPHSGPIRTLIEDAIGRATRAERHLAQAESRVEWLESRNVCDDLTGLLNRRGFADALHRGVARSRRYGENGALLLLDLARYEELVEAQGASAADYVLTAIANILRRRFREVDYIARLDGGRFAVLLVSIAEDDARRRAAMLKGHLEEIAVPWHGADIPIHVRVGLVHYGQNDISGDLLDRAEAELDERERRLARLRGSAE